MPLSVRTLAQLTAHGTSWLACALVVAWLVGRIATDQCLLTQYIFWVPTVVVLPGALALTAVGWLVGLVARRRPGRAPARLARVLALVGAIGMGGHLVLAEWRVHRLAWPERASTGNALTVLSWNPSIAALKVVPDRVVALKPDIVLIGNPPSRKFIIDMAAEMGTVRELGDGSAGLVPASSVSIGQLAAVSKLPIIRWGWAPLGLNGEMRPEWLGGDPEMENMGLVDTGRAMFVEIDTRDAWGRTTVAWVIDMPSDIALHRRPTMRAAAEKLRTYAGPQYFMTPGGNSRVERLDGGFPAPDLMVGDFNTPAGSGSISLITGDLQRVRGGGIDGTWPREWPMWKLDQLFVAGWLRTGGYRVVDPEVGEHRAQMAWVEVR